MAGTLMAAPHDARLLVMPDLIHAVVKFMMACCKVTSELVGMYLPIRPSEAMSLICRIAGIV